MAILKDTLINGGLVVTDKVTTPLINGYSLGDMCSKTASNYQLILVSGTNIKTVANNSILGSGNIDITKSNVGLSNVENTALSTWGGSSNLTTLGTITTGTWQGTVIADGYVASASTWNAKQNALTFDTSPTSNSTNPATSGGIYTALSGKASSSHVHAASDITSGVLGLLYGGTGRNDGISQGFIYVTSPYTSDGKVSLLQSTNYYTFYNSTTPISLNAPTIYENGVLLSSKYRPTTKYENYGTEVLSGSSTYTRSFSDLSKGFIFNMGVYLDAGQVGVNVYVNNHLIGLIAAGDNCSLTVNNCEYSLNVILCSDSGSIFGCTTSPNLTTYDNLTITFTVASGTGTMTLEYAANAFEEV